VIAQTDASSNRPPWLTPVCVVVLSSVAALLYFYRLGSSTPYLSIEEVFQARQAVVLATTGRNLNGELPSLYFPDPDQPMGREPIFIYGTAALLTLFPYSEATARAPSALAGVLDVVLMFFVARAVFGATMPGIVAACLLMFTPVHFFQTRIGHMQIGTVTCALVWLALLVRYINTDRPWNLFGATLALGVGMYVYGSGLVIMPLYFLVTLLLVWLHARRPESTAAFKMAGAGFLLAALPLATYYLMHLERFTQLAAFYTRGEYNAGLGSEGFFGAKAISHFDAWWNCYNPDQLFFSGDSDMRVSTRTVGYFFLSTGVPMLVGTWRAKRLLKFELWVLLNAGLVLASVPAAVVSSTDMKRWLTFVPFAILAATCGVQWMLRSQGRFGKAMVLILLLFSASQTRNYLTYYFGAFRLDSSARFGGNVRGAIQEVLAQASTSGACVMLDRGVYYLDHQWDLYHRAYVRTDLDAHTSWFGPGATAVTPPAGCRATTALGHVDDRIFVGWRSTPIHELDGTVRFAVYHRDQQ
jgi:4-amino-4-deoxy-L-arabinose transferase-like glycosyltransferase